MESTQPTSTEPSPAPVIGTPAEQTTHRPAPPTPAEHNATIQQARDAGTLPRCW